MRIIDGLQIRQEPILIIAERTVEIGCTVAYEQLKKYG